MFKKRKVKGSEQRKAELPKFDEHEQVEDDIHTFSAKRRKVLLHHNSAIKDTEEAAKDEKSKLKKVNERRETDSAHVLTVQDSATREGVFEKEMEAENTVKPAKNAVKLSMKSNLKTKILMDYQPDICKDFKQTGYCGYGDSCKFLHSRDDFKAGWQLNHEWKVEEQGVQELEKELRNIPFKCVLCKSDYKSPVVTSCEHYFCSSCFMALSKTTTKCAICGEETHGTVRIASRLKKLLKEQAKVEEDRSGSKG